MAFRGITATVTAVLVLLVSSSGASAAEFEEFGIQEVGAELSTASAGDHPDFTTSFVLNHHLEEGSGRPEATAKVENVVIDLPPGLIGNPTKFPKCKTKDFVALGLCPTDAQVGISEVLISNFGTGVPFIEPLYVLEPPHERSAVARLGFFAGIYPIYIDVKVRTASDYGVRAEVRDASGLTSVIAAKTTIWANPPAPIHDEQRLTAPEAFFGCTTACFMPEGKRPSGLPEMPFLTNPSACQSQHVDFAVSSYQLPGKIFTALAPLAAITGCKDLSFKPTLEVEPTSRVAGATTGLRAVLQIPQVEEVNQLATSTMRAARVTLPKEMTIASGAADGLEACSAERVGLGTELPSDCPDASKLGQVTIASPALSDVIHGTVYQRTPEPGHQFRLWLVTDEFGLHIKLPGEIRTNPENGQLTAEFLETPQLPVERIEMEIWDGERAPLKNPDDCGTYATQFALSPWSGKPPVVGESQTTIDQGCGVRPFGPRLQAGVTEPVAGAFSPLLVNFFREDREQNLKEVDIQLPKGLLAKLAGVSVCGDDAAASGSCPENSRIGSVTAAVGPGPRPLWLPQAGKEPTAVYLAGQYKGAPYSILTKVPAQAGPFDLGAVLVRSALHVDPETAQASVRSDPLPQFVEGVPVLYRTVSISIDRPSFTVNPTSCEEKAFRSTFISPEGAVSRPGTIFHVGGCSKLDFKPKLSLRLKGGTKRADYPALVAVLETRRGDANIRRASVALPHSEFLAQEHIRTICTRVQFAENDCPKGSIYGYASAKTPLLDTPLRGPVYLRSSDHPLPDLVAALRGPVDIALVGRIDSHNGGIRTTFGPVPDARVTRFVLRMKGGRQSLLTNSQDICNGIHRADVQMDGQNGRLHDAKPELHASCGGRG